MRMTVKEAAAYIPLSASKLNKLRLYGGGPIYTKVGGRILYDRRHLDEWISAGERRSTSDDPATRPRRRRAA